MTHYRLTFDTMLRLTADVAAETEPDAHFKAFCKAAAAIQNCGDISNRLAIDGLTVDRLMPHALLRIKPTQRKNDQ